MRIDAVARMIKVKGAAMEKQYEIGNLITELRKEKKLTQSKLAEARIGAPAFLTRPRTVHYISSVGFPNRAVFSNILILLKPTLLLLKLILYFSYGTQVVGSAQ